MLTRCRDPKHKEYHRYGGRGIVVCERWQNFENFLTDMGERPEEHTIDRIDNDGNYEPGNCRWAPDVQQARKTSRTVYLEFGGERLSLCDWADRLGISAQTLRARIRRGWSIERALCPPAV